MQEASTNPACRLGFMAGGPGVVGQSTTEICEVLPTTPARPSADGLAAPPDARRGQGMEYCGIQSGGSHETTNRGNLHRLF